MASKRASVALTVLAAATWWLAASADGEVAEWCGLEEHTDELVRMSPRYAIEIDDAKEQVKKRTMEKRELKSATPTVFGRIGVHFHSLWHASSPQEQLSVAQLQSQINVLNEDFSASNKDISTVTYSAFAKRIGSTHVSFYLKGHTSRQVPDSFACDSDSAMKKWSGGGLDTSDPSTTLNVWLCKFPSSTKVAYTYMPCLATSGTWMDGVVIRPDFVGRASDNDGSFYLNSRAGFQFGRSLTHEVGHYLSLPHTFAGGCSSGDGISDTPAVAAANSGACPNGGTSKNSCSDIDAITHTDLPDNLQNHMDYTNGNCRVMFTSAQAEQMISALEVLSCRKNLLQPLP